MFVYKLDFLAAKEKPNTKLCDYRSAQLSRQYTTKDKPAKCFGLFVTRLNKVGTYIHDDRLGHIFVWITNIDKERVFLIGFIFNHVNQFFNIFPDIAE